MDRSQSKEFSHLSLVKKWLDQNILSLNVTKTKFMPISMINATDYDLDFQIIHCCGDTNNHHCNCNYKEQV